MSEQYDVWIKIDGSVTVPITAESLEDAISIGRKIKQADVLKLNRNVEDMSLDVSVEGVMQT